MLIIASWAASSASRLDAGDPPAHGVDAVVVAAQQGVEGGAVAGLGGGDQRGVVAPVAGGHQREA